MTDHSKIIELEAHRKNQCQHLRVLVDPSLDKVECRDCGEKLDALATLYRLTQEESRLAQRIEQKKWLDSKISKRVRCKCEHCGRMTRIKTLA